MQCNRRSIHSKMFTQDKCGVRGLVMCLTILILRQNDSRPTNGYHICKLVLSVAQILFCRGTVRVSLRAV